MDKKPLFTGMSENELLESIKHYTEREVRISYNEDGVTAGTWIYLEATRASTNEAMRDLAEGVWMCGNLDILVPVDNSPT